MHRLVIAFQTGIRDPERGDLCGRRIHPDFYPESTRREHRDNLTRGVDAMAMHDARDEKSFVQWAGPICFRSCPLVTYPASLLERRPSSQKRSELHPERIGGCNR